MKYIDVHAHIFPENIAPKVVSALETYYGFRWEGRGVVDDLLRSMDEAGVQRAVIFSSATKPSQVESINNFIAEVQAAHPERFIGFGTMQVGYAGFKAEIRRMRSLGLRGIKFHPDFQHLYIDAPRMVDICAEVGDSMPLIFHTGDWRTDYSSPYRLARLLDLLPGLRVIAAHFGGYAEMEEARRHLVGRDLWLDTSSMIGHFPTEELRRIALAHGIDRILFASDYPGVRQKHAIDDVLSLGLGDEANEKIFHRNAAALLGLTDQV